MELIYPAMNKISIIIFLFTLPVSLLLHGQGNKPVPTIERIEGTAFVINSRTGTPQAIAPRTRLTQFTIIRLDGESTLVFSCPGGIAGKVTGPARFILGPPLKNRYELNLRQGTVAILLDPDRPRGSPEFAVRTDDGYALAEGTFYAVTEYKGQAYGKVKNGTIKTKPKPPMERNFAAYGRKPKPDLGKVAKAD